MDTTSAGFRGTSFNTMTLTRLNSTDPAYIIDTLYFDIGARSNGPDGFSLTYTSGGLGPASVIIDT